MGNLVSALMIWGISVAAGQADVSGRFQFENTSYRYFLSLPPEHGPNTPLIVMLHGYGDTAPAFRQSARLDDSADARGVAVVYPQAHRDEEGQRAWNVGEGSASKDDLAFLIAAITRLQASYGFDRKRIFVIGFSNGGYMAYRLGCAAPDMFAAFAIVAGTMSAVDWQSCAPKGRTPLLHIHGRDDEVVPIAGALPVADITARWAGWNKSVRSETGRSYSNGYVTRYYDGAGQLVTEMAELADMGHDWPIGFEDRYYATDEIWRFFERVAPWDKPTP